MPRMRAMAVVLSVIVVATLEAQSGKVSGTLVVNGKKVPIQHISAVSYDTPSPGRLVSVLVWTNQPIRRRFVNTRASAPVNATWPA